MHSVLVASGNLCFLGTSAGKEWSLLLTHILVTSSLYELEFDTIYL